MHVAVRLWTSAATLHGREFCSILNQALREDAEDTIGHAATITHALNAFCVNRRAGGAPVRWPSAHITYRGTALPRTHHGFFVVGKKYRAPMFLATSSSEDTAVDTFLMRLEPPSAEQAPPWQEPVLWRFHLDGNKPESARCKHLNFIDRTDGTVHGEDEYLYAPYSTFTVRAVAWEEAPLVDTYTVRHHIIDLDVASDNRREPLELPSAPWC